MIKIAGKLIDGASRPVADATIILRSVKNGSVPTGIVAEVTTDENGEYSFEAQVGSYLCYIMVEGIETALPGYVNIYKFSGEGTLQEYLYAPCEKDARPMFIFMWELIRQEINQVYANSITSEERIKEMMEQIEAMYKVAADGGNVSYKTIPEGMAATQDGGYFRVEELNNSRVIFTWYRKSGTQAIRLGAVPDEAAIREVLGFIGTQKNKDIVAKIVSSLGYSLFNFYGDGTFGSKTTKMLDNGFVTKKVSMLSFGSGGGITAADELGRSINLFDNEGYARAKKLSSGNNILTMDSRPEILRIYDGLGRGRTIIDSEIKGGGETPVDEIEVAVQRINALCVDYQKNVKAKYNPNIERFIFNICHIIWYGQSLSTNQEGFPALTKAINAMLDNYMLGRSSRPASRGAAVFAPVGEAKLNPLYAVTQSADGAKVLSQTEENALKFGDPNEGEGGVACVNYIKRMFLDMKQLPNDPSRKFVLSNCGVNGRTIAALSKDANPELYNRIRDAIRQVKNIADADNLSYGIPAVFHSQGEWDYSPREGAALTEPLFFERTMKLFDDFTAEFCQGQRRPAIFTYQTSATYTRDDYDLAIGMAQLKMATGDYGIYGTCPSYPMPDKGGHFTSNGYRWLDMYHAKVAFKVMILGEGWEPLHAIHGEIIDNSALLGYNVPAPPLKFAGSLVGRAFVNYPSKGFRATDQSGTLPINAVNIAAGSVLKIDFSRKPVGKVRIWYADKTVHNGNGNLQDSDDFMSMYNYEYIPGSSQTEDENISELVGKPYPLNNWAFAQIFEIEA